MRILENLLTDLWGLRVLFDGFLPELLQVLQALLILSGVAVCLFLFWAFAKAGWDIFTEWLADKLGV